MSRFCKNDIVWIVDKIYNKNEFKVVEVVIKELPDPDNNYTIIAYNLDIKMHDTLLYSYPELAQKRVDDLNNGSELTKTEKDIFKIYSLNNEKLITDDDKTDSFNKHQMPWGAYIDE